MSTHKYKEGDIVVTEENVLNRRLLVQKIDEVQTSTGRETEYHFCGDLSFERTIESEIYLFEEALVKVEELVEQDIKNLKDN